MNFSVLNNSILEVLENKCQIDDVLMDFAKAYDRVDQIPPTSTLQFSIWWSAINLVRILPIDYPETKTNENK